MQLTLAAARASVESCSEGCRKAVASVTASWRASIGCAKSSEKESSGGSVSVDSGSDSDAESAGVSGIGTASLSVLLRFMTGL